MSLEFLYVLPNNISWNSMRLPAVTLSIPSNKTDHKLIQNVHLLRCQKVNILISRTCHRNQQGPHVSENTSGFIGPTSVMTEIFISEI